MSKIVAIRRCLRAILLAAIAVTAAMGADDFPLARYGGPIVFELESRPVQGQGFTVTLRGQRIVMGQKVGESMTALVQGWTFTNLDAQDPLMLVDGLLIGTGSAQRGDDTPVDLRRLPVRTVAEAMALLQSKAPVERAQGAWALGELGDTGSIPLLLQALKDEAWVVRRYALLSLNQRARGEQLIAAALESLTDKDSLIVETAIKILLDKGQGDKRLMPALLTHVEHQNTAIATAAIAALGEIGDEAALAALHRLLKKEPKTTVPALKDAMRKIEHRQWEERLLVAWREQNVAFLRATLQDPNFAVRLQAAEALAKVGPPAVDFLTSVLQEDDVGGRLTAVKALRKIGPPAVDALIAALADTNAEIRQEGAKALGETGDPRAVAPLVAALRDAERWVRQVAAEALGKIRDRRAVTPLIAALQDGEKMVRWRAVEALGEIGDHQAIEPLIALLQDDDQSGRMAAAEALGKITGEDFGRDHAKWQTGWQERK